MNNNLNFQFGMYDPVTDSIIVNWEYPKVCVNLQTDVR